jgi:Secretion system C-terminal sorting domain/Domain of unknown function (DUF5122) beta-propeller
MKGISLYTIVFFTLLSITANAQGVFKRTYGAADGFNEGNSVVQTPDTGFIIVGALSGFGGGTSDVLVIKTDKNGIQQWIKPIGWANVDVGKNIKATADGNYIICGYTNSWGNGGYDVLLVKINPMGDVLWSKTYGGADWDFGYNVCSTADGGFIIAGETYSFGAGNNDFYILKTDAAGTIEWERTLGTTRNDVGRSVVQTYDGTYLVVGYTTQITNTANNDLYFARLNAQGDTLWTKRKSLVGDDYAFDVAVTNVDSSYYIVGYTNSFTGANYNGYLTHFTKNDVEIAAYDITNPYDIKMYSAVARGINGQIGIAGDVIPDWDFRAFGIMNLISPTGDYIWGVNLNIDFEEENFYQIINCFGDGFAMVGSSKSVGPGLSSAALVTVDANSNSAPGYTVEVPEAAIGLKAITYPNPTTGNVRISLLNPAKQLSVILYNTTGQEVFNKTYEGVQQVDEDFSSLTNGLYMLRLTADGNYSAKQLIIAR